MVISLPKTKSIPFSVKGTEDVGKGVYSRREPISLIEVEERIQAFNGEYEISSGHETKPIRDVGVNPNLERLQIPKFDGDKSKF